MTKVTIPYYTVDLPGYPDSRIPSEEHLPVLLDRHPGLLPSLAALPLRKTSLLLEEVPAKEVKNRLDGQGAGRFLDGTRVPGARGRYCWLRAIPAPGPPVSVRHSTLRSSLDGTLAGGPVTSLRRPPAVA